MKIGYIYITTNLVNRKQYIGKRQSSTFDTKYFGSGKILGQAILKEGIENFKCEVIEWCDTAEDLNNREIYYIELYDAVASDKFYNLAAGGTGGNTGVDYAKIASREQSIEERHKRSESLKKAYAEGRHDVIRSGYPTGKRRTPEDIAANKQRNSNKVWINKDGKQTTIDKSLLEDYLLNGWVRGKLPLKTPVWNKGLTKETSEVLKQVSDNRKELLKTGSIGCCGLSGKDNYNHKEHN